jgi:hypothetical protein
MNALLLMSLLEFLKHRVGSFKITSIVIVPLRDVTEEKGLEREIVAFPDVIGLRVGGFIRPRKCSF